MGRDRKISRRDKTRQGQSLEIFSRQDKTRHSFKTNKFKTTQDSKRYVETRQDLQVLCDLVSRQDETFAIFKISRRDRTRQDETAFPVSSCREMTQKMAFQVKQWGTNRNDWANFGLFLHFLMVLGLKTLLFDISYLSDGSGQNFTKTRQDETIGQIIWSE